MFGVVWQELSDETSAFTMRNYLVRIESRIDANDATAVGFTDSVWDGGGSGATAAGGSLFMCLSISHTHPRRGFIKTAAGGSCSRSLCITRRSCSLCLCTCMYLAHPLSLSFSLTHTHQQGIQSDSSRRELLSVTHSS